MHNHTASLGRDAFGFRQVLVTATAYGSVFGLDTASGAVLWTRVLGLGWAGEGVGGTVKPVKIFVVDGEGDGKDVVLIAQRTATNVSCSLCLEQIEDTDDSCRHWLTRSSFGLTPSRGRRSLLRRRIPRDCWRGQM